MTQTFWEFLHFKLESNGTKMLNGKNYFFGKVSAPLFSVLSGISAGSASPTLRIGYELVY
jgi:hypothetical protein